MSKVLVVSDGYGCTSYHKPFGKFGELTTDSDLLWNDPRSIALVVFTGGQDVSPSLYGEEAAPETGCSPKRDIYESISFQKAFQLGLPMAGICRGSQFLNVMAGGKLVQHLDGHTQWHNMTIVDGRTMQVSSTHHQMMLPPRSGILLGWSTKKLSASYCGEGDRKLLPPKYETEVVYWPNINAIGMQYHPEIMGEDTPGFRLAAELCESYLF